MLIEDSSNFYHPALFTNFSKKKKKEKTELNVNLFFLGLGGEGNLLFILRIGNCIVKKHHEGAGK